MENPNSLLIVDQLSTIPPAHISAGCILTTFLISCALYLRLEFRAFKALGPGGTPQTLWGFIKVTALSFVRVSNPYEIGHREGRPTFQQAHLRRLPTRHGPRPVTRGIAPHRQVTQKGTDESYAMLVAAIDRLEDSSEDLRVATSCFEKHSSGLFVNDPVKETCAGEACHTHPSDGGSMHLTLHPSDVKVVLDAGWGERHPLAHGGWFERFVPEGFVLIYAPRDAAELRTVMEIVGAAISHVSEASLDKEEGELESGI